MKRVLYLWFCLVWCGISVSAQDQVIYVSALKGSDTWSGSQTQPYGTIYKALETAAAKTGTVEIRMAVGVYPISMVKAPKKGQLVIPSHVTVKGGYLHGEASSVQNVLATDRQSVGGQTILQGDSTCRIALVRGGLEQVVVRGGRAEGANGGGVLVESGGSVKNCIIYDNQASGRTPKVGDLLMRNGDYMDVSLFTYDQKDQVVGVVFWVNPKRDAPKGEKGRAVSVKQLQYAYGMVQVGYSGSSIRILVRNWPCLKDNVPDFLPYLSMDEALKDLEGEANTNAWLEKENSCVEFPWIKSCRALGDQWYIPAAGELMLMLAEWSMVDNTLNALWEKIRIGAGSNFDIVREYFGLASSVVISSWYTTSNIAWYEKFPIASSSSSGPQKIWKLESFTNESRLEELSVLQISNQYYTLAKVKSFAICRF